MSILNMVSNGVSAASGAAGAAGAAFPYGAALSAVSGLVGSIGSGKKAYHRSKKLMDKQFAMDKEMYDYQNKYNLPSAQMARLKAAGLNPALMYGQGTTGNASNPPQSKFTQLNPYMNAGDVAQLSNAGAQMALVLAQKNNVVEDTRVKQTVANRNLVLSKKDKAEIRKINRSIVNMDTQTAKMLQETSNLKDVQAYQRLQNELQTKVVDRAKKGIIKGDTIGNILEMFGLDPVNNKKHQDWLYGALAAWYGATIAKNIMQGVGALIPKQTTNINPTQFFKNPNN